MTFPGLSVSAAPLTSNLISHSPAASPAAPLSPALPDGHPPRRLFFASSARHHRRLRRWRSRTRSRSRIILLYRNRMCTLDSITISRSAFVAIRAQPPTPPLLYFRSFCGGMGLTSECSSRFFVACAAFVLWLWQRRATFFGGVPSVVEIRVHAVHAAKRSASVVHHGADRSAQVAVQSASASARTAALGFHFHARVAEAGPKSSSPAHVAGCARSTGGVPHRTCISSFVCCL